MSAAPYWGDLPGPKVASRANSRHSSADQSSKTPRRQSTDTTPAFAPQPKPHRISTQTAHSEAQTESSLSPYASPTHSFQGQGLAPRPPSMSSYPPDIVEKRRRRANKNREEDNAYTVSGALPAAPDAPKGLPSSYRHPYGNGGLPYTLPKTGAAQPDIPPSPGMMDPETYQILTADRPKHASTASNRRISSDSAAPARNSSSREHVNGHRKASLGNEADRRLFADARSPLQRLELTLDSITKEEKRARAEAAERNARERSSGRRTSRDGGRPHSVRFQDKSTEPDAELLPDATVLPDSLPVETGAAPGRRGDDFQPKGQRHESHRGKAPKPRAVVAAGAQDSGSPHRNLSFRERAAQNEANLPNSAVPEITASAANETGPTNSVALGRSGSNRLKKDPPGDPWYQRRVEAEKKYGQITGGGKPGASRTRKDETAGAPAVVGPPSQTFRGSVRNKVPAANTTEARRQHDRPAVADDDVDSLANSSHPDSLARQRRGSTSGGHHSPFPFTTDSQQQHDVADHPKSKARLGTALGATAAGATAVSFAGRASPPGNGSDEDTPFSHEHHFSEHFHRHLYKPGEGLYNPPKYLEEWRKGTVGTLAGSFLDLADGTSPVADKNQTWWETSPSQKRGSISSRPRRAEAFDGEYDETNGTHSSIDTMVSRERTEFDRGYSQSWSIRYDDVVPHAREFLGHQATASKRKARRQTRLYSIGQHLAPSSDVQGSNCISVLCSCLPCLPPRHQRQYSESTLLTRAARMAIRMPEPIAPTRFKPPLYLKCGPLLRYCGIRNERVNSRSTRNSSAAEREFWRGTVMIVTADADSSCDIAPTLRLFAQPIELLPPPPPEVHGEIPPEYVDPVAGHPKLGRKGETLYVRPAYHLEEARDLSQDGSDNGLFEKTRSPPDVDLPAGSTDAPGSFADRRKKASVDGEKLGKYKDVRGYRLHTERGYTFWRFSIEVELRDKEQRIAYRINRGPATGFWVPAKDQSMNIMFHSCNGFSLSVNPDELSGPDPMWRDVLNNHQSRPFHVMIGGGDQLYCDAVMRQTQLFQEWLVIRNPIHKHNAPFTAEMQDELENFYLERYCTWFSQGLFGLANAQIPMVNMYDDHDIIDGFGSYPHHFMTSPVFSGLGNVAFKYYMLFQHQSLVSEMEDTEPSWALGVKPGPYIQELSRSVFMHLGSKIALLGVDTRTERMRDQVVEDQTWDKLIDRCYSEIVKGKTEHLLVLLGVPIAYPRLVWLENILTSRLLDPIKALGKTGLFGNVFNKFDGGVEVLDDLDDHWTAKNHKEERKIVIEDLQDLAADRSVRVTILSGDVHLAAVGQFYSNPRLELAKHKDFRYMPNIISSAIVNTPPPDLMADVLNKRNKVHHLDKDTDEDMIPMFAHGVEGKPRNNKRLLPHRNWCSIREYTPGHTPPSTPPESVYDTGASTESPGPSGGGVTGKGVTRRLSKRDRGPPHRSDVLDSRPPVTSRGTGSLFRTLSSRGRRSADDVPVEGKRPKGAKRTLSLTRGDFGLFRRGSKNRAPKDDGGINGTWGESDPEDTGQEDGYEDDRRGQGFLGAIGLRGGGGSYEEFSEGDDSYFTARAPANTSATGSASKTARLLGNEAPPASRGGVHQGSQRLREGYGTTTTTVTGPAQQTEDNFRPKPFHRTPTSTSVRQQRKLKRARTLDVDIQGGLDICLNVEVSSKDPAGITVPYRLLVPKLWYDAAEGGEVEMPEQKVGGVKRLLSLSKGKGTVNKRKQTGDSAEWRAGSGSGQGQQQHRQVSGAEHAPGTAF